MSVYITSPNSTCPFGFLLPISLPSPITRQQVIYFLSLQLILYFLEISINRIMHYMFFLGSGGSGFFCSDILVNTWFYRNVVFIWILLMAKDVKPVLLFYAFTTLNEVSVHIFHFVLGCLFSYYWVLKVHSIFWIQVLSQACDFQSLLHVYSLSFYSLNRLFKRAVALNFAEV